MERKEVPSFTLSEDKKTVTFEYNFNRWDFDRAGHVPIWTLTYQGAWLTFNGLCALDPRLLADPTVRVFSRCQVWEISPSFYNLVKPGTRLKVSSRWLHLGKSSMIKGGEIVDSSTNQILVKGIIQDVNINLELDTPRSKPFPDWVKDSYSYLTSQPRPETVEAFEKPTSAKTFIYSVTVLPSDIDYNNHTNQRHYIRYCFNCAVIGARQGAYPTVRGDPFKQGVRKVSVLYQKESLEGDVLTVESWEESPGTLRFQMRKGSEKVVQVMLQFPVTSGSAIGMSKL
ncbi:Hypp6403 [Branchiostoma lanceolatum]|uniref:Hypp6403 protein n=1 Tax=Branchiostoma lanceolatum TaxID=7740 RepID=A0A8J9YU05_BRALA|nr:Hypp6403 [Branchiostoma lanceolatum]